MQGVLLGSCPKHQSRVSSSALQLHSGQDQSLHRSSLQMRSPVWPEYGVVSCSSFDGPSQGEGWDEGSGNHLAPQKLSTCDQCTLLEILNCPSHRPSCPDGLTAVLRNIPRSTRVVLRYQDDKGRFRAVRHRKVLVRMDTYISNKQKLTMV
jgi:hypothetical protein